MFKEIYKCFLSAHQSLDKKLRAVLSIRLNHRIVGELGIIEVTIVEDFPRNWLFVLTSEDLYSAPSSCSENCTICSDEYMCSCWLWRSSTVWRVWCVLSMLEEM